MIQWRVNGGVILPVDREIIPPWELPLDEDCCVISERGEPVFHVTVIGRRTLQPYGLLIAHCWEDVANRAPAFPSPKFEPPIRLAVKESRKTWYLPLANQSQYQQTADELARVIDAEFRKLGHAGFTNAETHRYFHISVANNQDGDPRRSIGGITPSE